MEKKKNITTCDILVAITVNSSRFFNKKISPDRFEGDVAILL